MVEDPLRDREVGPCNEPAMGAPCGCADAGRGLRNKHHRMARKGLGDVLDGNPGEILETPGRREFAAHRIEQRRAALARAGDAGLCSHVRDQVAMMRATVSITPKVTTY